MTRDWSHAEPADGATTCQAEDLAYSDSSVFGDPDVETVLNETAMKVAAAEVGAALHFSPVAAQRRVCKAVEFAVDLPGTLRALEGGIIDRGRSLTIAERTQNLPVELRRRVEQAVLRKAATRTPGQLRGIVDRAVISVDPAAAKKRHEKAVTKRNVTHHAAEDGMGVFRAEVAADKAQLAYSVIDQLAYQLKRSNLSACDPRGVGALRADVFSDLIDQLASTGTVTIRSALLRRAAGTSAATAQPTSSTAPPAPTDTSDPADEPDCSNDSAQPDGGAARSETVDSVVVDPRIVDNCAGDAREPSGDVSRWGAKGSGEGDMCVRFTNTHSGDLCGGEKGSDDVDIWIREECPAGGPQTAGNRSSGRAEDSGCAVNSVLKPDSGLGIHHGRVTHLNVTLAASTLAGLDDRPGELDGHGPIPADLARAIAASASTIAAIAIRPGCGAGLDLGRTAYRPRLAQRDHVTTRDQTCRFPGCRRPAKRCQIDHSDEFCPGESSGGVTCPCNLQCLCVFHHGLKTSGLWDSVQHSDASVTWTSPTGRSYSTQPRQWPTDQDDTADSPQDPIADPPPF